MSDTTRGISAALLLIIAIFFPTIEDAITPNQPSVAQILEIEEPSDEYREDGEKILDIVTGKKDREKLAIFNFEFSQRVSGYETTGQDYNDLYTLAGKTAFGSEYKDEYDDLGKFLANAFKSIIGEYDGIVSKPERESLKRTFGSYAWFLGS